MDNINCFHSDADHVRNECDKELSSAAETPPAQQPVPSSTDVENISPNSLSSQGNIVDWDAPDDPQNPQNWPSSKKWIIIILISLITFNQYACRTSVSPDTRQTN